jgi:RND family efflux transporter MFP subunit
MRNGIIGLLTILMVCSCMEKKEKGIKAPTRVKTEVVNGQSTMANGQSYVGIVEEREGTAVSFTGMGVLKRVLVSEGQAVGRGQLIAEMDDTQARNLLSGAEAAMNQANDALERYKMLHDNGSLPEVQWVEIQSKVAQAKSQYEVAKKNLADCRLTAPVSGIIGKKLVSAGETAMPSQAVVTILDISSVKVKVAVPEAEISGINSSTPSTISVEAAQITVNGGRIEKGVQADALTHTYNVRINVQNANRKLLPGMVASVKFLDKPRSNSTSDRLQPQGHQKAEHFDEGSPSNAGKTLPITAIQKAADGSMFVWTVAKDSTAHRVKVSIGETNGNYVAITDGLEMGQHVVTEGYQKLSEGSKVVF